MSIDSNDLRKSLLFEKQCTYCSNATLAIMNKCNEIDISYGLLAAQRALLGEVTPNLRAVVIDLEPKKKFGKIFFYYHGEVSEEVFDLASCVITEITAAFPVEYQFEEHIERLDAPLKIPFHGRIAYLRKES